MKREQKVDPQKIHQCFVPNAEQPPEQLARLLAEIAPAQLELAQQLAALADEMCATKLADSAVVAMADHLRFAIERAIAGQELPAPLQWEVQHFYPEEYAYGKEVIERVQKATGIRLAENEAVSFALHLVNSQLDARDQNFERTATLTQMLAKILDLVDAELPGGPGVLDRDSMATARFITHLKFLLQRLLQNKQESETHIPGLEVTIKQQYPEAYNIARRVVLAMNFELGQDCSVQETAYLSLHIARLMRAQH